MVKQNQEKAEYETVPPSGGVRAGHAPHLSEPQGFLQGEWFPRHPSFFPLSHFAVHPAVSGECSSFPHLVASLHKRKFWRYSKSPVV